MMVSDAAKQKAAFLLEEFARCAPAEDAMAFWKKKLPHGGREQAELAEALDRHGVALFNRGDAQAALNAFWPNFLLRLEIVTRHPSDRGAIRDFASAEDLIGLACIATQKIATAEEMLSEALKYRRGLYEDDPSDAHAAFLYGVALNHLGRLERAKGDDATAMAYFREAHDHLVEVDKRWRSVSFIEAELADIVASMQTISQ